MDKNKVTLGIAPINWTNDDMPDLGSEISFEQCISEMALAGFTNTEIGNKYPTDPEKLKKDLSIRGLQIVSTWFSSYFATNMEESLKEFEEKCKFMKAVGSKLIGPCEQSYSIQGKNTPIFTEKKPILTETEWESFITGMHKAGEIAKKYDLSVVYHQHMGTVVQTEEEFEKFVNMTNPELVSITLDTGHFYCAGMDPLEILKKYFHRFKHVHLKDVRKGIMKEVKKEKMSFLQAVRKGMFTVPGDGDINFEPIFNYLEEKSYEGCMYVEAEQDPAVAHPLTYAIKARKYIKEKAGI